MLRKLGLAGTDGNIKEVNTVDRVSIVHNNQEQGYHKVNETSEPLAGAYLLV